MSIDTSILLPSASVDLFLKDKATADAARALSDDWRFTRVKINVHDGGVEDAINVYRQGKSPDIILIETETTDESFTGRLGELSSHCAERTSAIVIGPVNDVNLYRSLTAMGVSDYLVRPVPIETLSEVIAETLVEKLGATGSRLIAMIGAKGGVGTSALSQALAWGSSETLGQKTLLLDAAGAWSSLGVGMGFEPLAGTAEAIKAVVAKDQDSLRRMLYQANDKLFVLATGTESMLESPAALDQFEEILNTALSSYPVVIVDLSGAPHSVQKTVLGRAHETIVVSTPTLPSLRCARALMGEIKKIHGGQQSNLDLIVNMAGFAPGKEVPKTDIKMALDMEPTVTIAFDPKLFIGTESEGQKLSSDKGGQEVLQKLVPLIQKLVSRDQPVASSNETEGLLGSLLGKMKPKK